MASSIDWLNKYKNQALVFKTLKKKNINEKWQYWEKN